MWRLLQAGGAQVRSMTTTVRDVPIHHLEAGSGRPVVLLHGGSGGGANWFRIIPLLAGRCRVVAPDLPGFGLSGATAPARPLGGLAADWLSAWLDTVLDDGEQAGAIVVGTSFGGLAALRLAQRAPHHVAGLLLLDSAGLGRELPLLVRMATLPGLAGVGMRPTRSGTATMFRRLLSTNRSSITQEQQAALVEYLYLSARRAGTPYLVDTLRHFASLRGQREVLSDQELAGLPMPVAVVWGALDTFLPQAHGERAARLCPDATITAIANAGHSPNWETPQEVASVIEALLERCA